MMNQTPPQFRAWHLISKQMYQVASIEWDPLDTGISVIIAVSGDINGVCGKLSDFVLMRKSSLRDLVDQPIYSGDILALGKHSKYPAEVFVVNDFEDGLCVNSIGVRIPLHVAVNVYGAHKIGNIFENNQSLRKEAPETYPL